jgi:TubC N-terminal docking domain
MQADLVLNELGRRGFAVRVADGKLMVSPADKLTPEITAAIKACRDGLVALLQELAFQEACAAARAEWQALGLDVDPPFVGNPTGRWWAGADQAAAAAWDEHNAAAAKRWEQVKNHRKHNRRSA